MTLICTIGALSVPATAHAATQHEPALIPSKAAKPSPPSKPGEPSKPPKPSKSPNSGHTPGSSADKPEPTDGSPPEPDVESARLDAVRKKLDKLYHEAGVATDAYNSAEEKADQQSRRIITLAERIITGQSRLDQLRARVGAAARAQYRGGGLPDEAKLILSDDPSSFLEGTDRLRQGQQGTKGLLAELNRTQKELRDYTKDAQQQWKKLESNRKAKAAAQQKVKKRIAEAEKLESKLEKEERERLKALEKAAQSKAQAAWLDSGILDEIKGKASASGKKALDYASEQLGKPYQWGAEGPKTYDCSGLTSQAWLSAGHAIPRTSQEQWRQLPRIDIRDMRPGDLIIYHDDASHVGMYIGNGSIIHAPRPGRHVTVAGAGSMSILGVVRPDK
ncbi:C40 family peptidase [Streptomyces sp. NA04227]|uniref:C40 family peptidase n=1 Tax=Streptomyces sp. NA04227 TaxID=2742136 RepID=UPI001591F28A|nr:NlpC/P60 family protein [Streptomyces sp. NA04227]QKW11015.1 C40 family peptidase [Streptomyces sp. NA04227]